MTQIRNKISAINTWTVSLVRYTAGIINWRRLAWSNWHENQ